MGADPIQALARVIDALDARGILYAIGGSFASSTHGEPRSSVDYDILTQLGAGDVAPLVEALQAEFYVSEAAASDAVARRSSFNVIHLATHMKVDLFVCGNSALDAEQMRRRQASELAPGSGRMVFVTSPEDIVLRKLDWFRRGGGVSDRQWRDVLGVLKVQGARLDREHMTRIAVAADLSDLLDKALREAGLS